MSNALASIFPCIARRKAQAPKAYTELLDLCMEDPHIAAEILYTYEIDDKDIQMARKSQL